MGAREHIIHANWGGGIHRHPMSKPSNFLFCRIGLNQAQGLSKVGLWGSPPWAETWSMEVLMNMLKIPTKNKSAKLHMIIARLVPSRQCAPWSIASSRWVWERSFQVALQRGGNGHSGRLNQSSSSFCFQPLIKCNHHSSWSNLPASLMLSHTFPADTGPKCSSSIVFK